MSIEKEKETDGMHWGSRRLRDLGTWKADQSAKPKAIAIGVNDGALHILFHLLNLTANRLRREYFVKLGSLEG